MRVGGLQKNSLIDYPGKISCVVFVAGCNFHCPYCHNPDLLIPDPALLPRMEVFDFLEKRKGLLDAVVVSGGEPTLQPDLVSFCQTVKSMGFLLKVDTNGSRPQVLEVLIQNSLLDYLAMDLKTLPELYAPHISTSISRETLEKSIELIMASGIDHEFRITCAKPLVSETILLALAQRISGARRFALQTYQSVRILNPDFFLTEEKQFSTEDLKGLKPLLEPFFGDCLVR